MTDTQTIQDTECDSDEEESLLAVRDFWTALLYLRELQVHSQLYSIILNRCSQFLKR